jgi:hypothetical protein
MKNAYHRKKNPVDMMPLTTDEENEFNKSTNCHICEKEFKKSNRVIDFYNNQWTGCHKECSPFTEEQRLTVTRDYYPKDFNKLKECSRCNKSMWADKKCHDHDHITGKYRGSAHYLCNLNYKLPDFITCYAHNGSKYDFKFIINELKYRKCEINVIAQSSENFMCIEAKYYVGDYTDKKTGELKPEYFKIRFIDSIRFMGKSLEKLVMYQEGNLPITKSFYNN